LLPGDGDRGGTLIGQPLNTYGEGLVPGNNLSGQQFWSPDSTTVLLQERTTTRPPVGVNEHVAQKGLTPNRILIARIRRPQARPGRTFETKVGDWAPTPLTAFNTTNSNRTVVVPGARGGTATLTYRGMLADGTWSTTYDAYTEDGETFVDGTVSASRNLAGVWHVDADVHVRGAHTGRLQSDLVIGPQGPDGLPTKTGTITAVYDGRRAPDLPALGPCPQQLPTRNDLAVVARANRGGHVTVTVAAAIAGDRRPVAGARVHLAGQVATTDRRGRARLRMRGAGRYPVTVDAGDTFHTGRAQVTVE
jgi:hypothetical protein